MSKKKRDLDNNDLEFCIAPIDLKVYRLQRIGKAILTITDEVIRKGEVFRKRRQSFHFALDSRSVDAVEVLCRGATDDSFRFVLVSQLNKIETHKSDKDL